MLDATTEERPGAAEVEVDSAARLRSLVNRVEALHAERKALGSDVSDIYTEAASAGFDAKALKALIRVRARDPAELENEELLVETYRRALEG